MTFDSVYEMFDPLTAVRDQRFWEWFSGNDLKSYWIKNDLGPGTPVFSMSDSIDGGFRIFVTDNDAKGTIDFGDKRQYSFNSSRFIAVFADASGTQGRRLAGLGNDDDLIASSNNFAAIGRAQNTTFFAVTSADGATRSDTNTTTSLDTNLHSFDCVLGISNITGKIDGVDQTVKTTNLPTLKLQPVVFCGAESNADTFLDITYFEVFNT